MLFFRSLKICFPQAATRVCRALPNQKNAKLVAPLEHFYRNIVFGFSFFGPADFTSLASANCQ